MKPFAGFPAGKTRFTPLPDLFFTELLAASDDLAELKVTLYMFWSLNRQRGYPRYLTVGELEAEGPLLSALLDSAQGDPLPILREAVERAVDRGTLLRLSICRQEGERAEAAVADRVEQTEYLFLNTAQGRRAVEQVKNGELVLEATGYIRETHIAQEHPPILELYEKNIGLLQPLLVEELEEAEHTYPADWIEEAFKIAVEFNARNWRYIKSILERWAREGKDDGLSLPSRRGQRSGYGARNRR
jgi:DnaD/phage-associated family protein